MNGTYIREVGVPDQGASPVYTKRGVWGGKLCEHAIYRGKISRSNTYAWFFGHLNEGGRGGPSKRLYVSCLNASSLTPPEDGWGAITVNGGVNPPPKCQIIYDNVLLLER